MYSELPQNQTGHLGRKQRRHLQKWFLYRILSISLNAYLLSLALKEAWGWRWSLIAIAVTTAAFFIWAYGLDLWYGKPAMVSGRIEKTSKRIRGPRHYYIVVNGVQIRASKAVWQSLDENREYEIYYSPRSKWLLSYTHAQ